MSAFDSLPDGFVEFSPLSPQQQHGLAALKNRRVPLDRYVAMEFPIRIGRLTSKGIAAHAPDPGSTPFYTHHTAATNKPTSEIANLLLEKNAYRFDDKPPNDASAVAEATKIRMQAGIISELLDYARQQTTGWKSRLYGFIFITRPLRPQAHAEWDLGFDYQDLLKDKFYGKIQGSKTRVKHELFFTWSSRPWEFIRNPWQKDGTKYEIDPLVKSLALNLEDLNEDGLPNNARKKLEALRDQNTEEMQAKGLLVKTEPYDIYLCSTRTYIRPVSRNHIGLRAESRLYI